MRKSRFTETQIVTILGEGEAGVPIAETNEQLFAFMWPAENLYFELEVLKA